MQANGIIVPNNISSYKREIVCTVASRKLADNLGVKAAYVGVAIMRHMKSEALETHANGTMRKEAIDAATTQNRPEDIQPVSNEQAQDEPVRHP